MSEGTDVAVASGCVYVQVSVSVSVRMSVCVERKMERWSHVSAAAAFAIEVLRRGTQCCFLRDSCRVCTTAAAFLADCLAMAMCATLVCACESEGETDPSATHLALLLLQNLSLLWVSNVTTCFSIFLAPFPCLPCLRESEASAGERRV